MNAPQEFSLSNNWFISHIIYWIAIALVGLAAIYLSLDGLLLFIEWRPYALFGVGLALAFLGLSQIYVTFGLFSKYRKSFVRVGPEGIMIFDSLIPWTAINSLENDANRIRIYMADPTAIDVWKLLQKLYAGPLRTKGQTGDVYLPGVAFEMPINQVLSILHSHQPHASQISKPERQLAVSKGRRFRRKDALQLFGTVFFLVLGYGIYIQWKDGLGSFLVPYIILLSIIGYTLFEAWRLPKE